MSSVRRHQVLHGVVVTAPKTLPIVLAKARLYVRMSILSASFNVGKAVMIVVLHRALHAIVKAALFHLLELRRRLIPGHCPLGSFGYSSVSRVASHLHEQRSKREH